MMKYIVEKAKLFFNGNVLIRLGEEPRYELTATEKEELLKYIESL